jgi:hypothetical protein
VNTTPRCFDSSSRNGFVSAPFPDSLARKMLSLSSWQEKYKNNLLTLEMAAQEIQKISEERAGRHMKEEKKAQSQVAG